MRLEEKFKQLNKESRKAFIAYVPFGFPDVAHAKPVCLALQEAGVDVIELGIPFSDPLADGPIIQRASTQALAKGANLNNFFKTVQTLQKELTIPLVIMTYYNPIFRYGIEAFLKKLKQVAVSAVLVVDLPLEESASYIRLARRYSIDTVFFATPTTSLERLKKIVRQSKGFIYYISITGITGPKVLRLEDVKKHVAMVKGLTRLPVCVGFGIHTRAQVVGISSFSDGVIVGSPIVQYIEIHWKEKQFFNKLRSYVQSLCLK
jgi:tryptophan synthase alpha chain